MIFHPMKGTAMLASMLRSGVTAALTFVAASTASAATAPRWKTSDQITNPESAYFDAASKAIYVSNVAGQAMAKDAKGSVAKIVVDAKGKPTVTTLIDGLNAPKGIRVQNGVLFVSDIDVLIKADVATGKILERIAVPGATFLNDVALAANGDVYVSDTISSKIHVVDAKTGKPSVFVEGPEFESPNGLLVQDGKLIVAAWGFITDPATFGAKTPGNVYALDLKTKARTTLTKTPLGNLDGLERLENGDFLVSDWVSSKIYRLNAKGEAKLIRDGFKNAADIGLQGTTVLVPDMSANEVIAFDL